MALPNGTVKEWPFEEEPDLNDKYLPLVGQYVLHGWQHEPRSSQPAPETWNVKNIMDYTEFGTHTIVETRFHKYMRRGARILLHQHSVKGYFIFDLYKGS